MRIHLSYAKRIDLVQLYIDGGRKAIAAECAELGISVQTIVNHASSMGMFRKKTGTCGNKNDKRWQWAIERGPVVA